MSDLIKNRALMGALFVALSAGGLLGGLWYWLDVEKQELAELKSRVGESTQTQASIQSMRSLVRETQDERNELSGYFLKVEDPASFLELIEASAQDMGVTLEITAVTVENEGGKSFVAVSLEYVGTFEACYRFLELIEHLPYAVSVQQTSLLRDGEVEQGGWSGTMLLRVRARP